MGEKKDKLKCFVKTTDFMPMSKWLSQFKALIQRLGFSSMCCVVKMSSNGWRESVVRKVDMLLGISSPVYLLKNSLFQFLLIKFAQTR